MIAAGLVLSGCKQAIGGIPCRCRSAAVDLDRAGLVQRILKGFGTGSCLVSLDGHKHPALGPVDDHKQVSPLGLVLHLGQVLQIHVKKPGLVAPEGLVWLLESGGLQGIEISHAMVVRTPIQPRARDSRAQKLARDGQQIIKR